MTLWIIFGIMTIAAALFVLWPLAQRTQIAAQASDIGVYTQQLEELDNERSLGRISEAEAEAARIELSRRLLHASEHEEAAAKTGTKASRIAAVVAACVIILTAYGFYGTFGAPNVPGMPLAERMAKANETKDLPAMVAQIEAHLRDKPDDVKGWEVVAPIFARMGRVDDAIRANKEIIRLSGSTAERETALGELYVMNNDGNVSDDALAAFERALAKEPKDPKARFFKGLHAAQNNRNDEAKTIWQTVINDSPADAPWVPFIKMQMAQLDKPETGPDSAAGRDIQQMPAQDREAIIRQMVSGLAERLKQDGSDANGWLRLIRAYMVMNDKPKAEAALVDAKKALSGNSDAMKQLADLAKELKIGQE